MSKEGKKEKNSECELYICERSRPCIAPGTANGWPLHGTWPAHVQTGLASLYPSSYMARARRNQRKQVGVVWSLLVWGKCFTSPYKWS
jgi:hypothetical protein